MSNKKIVFHYSGHFDTEITIRGEVPATAIEYGIKKACGWFRGVLYNAFLTEGFAGKDIEIECSMRILPPRFIFWGPRIGRIEFRVRAPVSKANNGLSVKIEKRINMLIGDGFSFDLHE